ncbi:MAG: bifunctional diaminohydroxyphosphoribosylaminopyrimidine deaminase/5-amino-6-(5-phosphoribosylamino)uracil reductase RibD [candidate division WOR-3 bacterium]
MSGERFMREALELAARGRGFVSPNPMVGAVLVKHGRIVGRGWHRRFGGAHAEVEAIRAAGANARGSTLYVTMEPCCFEGKTPACTDAIVPAGIRHVEAAVLDPNPRVNGRGLRCLRAQGIKTGLGLLQDEARQLNEAYFTFVKKRRPFVVLKIAVTLDGMIADRWGRSQWLTSVTARRFAQELRRSVDAVVVGAGTVRADNPRLTCRIARNKRLVRVVLDTELTVSPRSRLFQEPGPVAVLCGLRHEARAARLERQGAEVVALGTNAGGLLSWPRILGFLYRRGLAAVLIEGGATVAASALEAGVVDKAYVFHAPLLLGPGRAFTARMRSRKLSQAIRLSRVEHRSLGSDVLTEGYVHRTD